MEQLVYVAITGLATTVSALAVTIYKLQNATIAELKETIRKQDEREDQQRVILEGTVTTLKAVVDAGLAQPPSGTSP